MQIRCWSTATIHCCWLTGDDFHGKIIVSVKALEIRKSLLRVESREVGVNDINQIQLTSTYDNSGC